MTIRTEHSLRTQFQKEAAAIDAPPELQAEVLRRATSTRTRHRAVRSALVVGVSVVLAAAVVVAVDAVQSSVSPTPVDEVPVPASWTFDLNYLVNEGELSGRGRWSMTAESVAVPNTGTRPWMWSTPS